jgi:type IV pilus assembly protein PilX
MNTIAFPTIRPRRAQRGVSLLVVMVMMLLSLLLVLGGSRVGLLNEKMAGNSADYQRAYEAAEALLSDAQHDLACLQGLAANCTGRATVTQFTCDSQQFADLQATLSALTPQCQEGVCLDLGTAVSGDPATSFWNSAANGVTPNWTTFTSGNRGASFGQYTNAAVTTSQAANPILVSRAWYWIEILPYGGSAGGGRSVASEQAFSGGITVKPDINCQFVFRITAAAQGLKPGTMAVLQSLQFFRPS